MSESVFIETTNHLPQQNSQNNQNSQNSQKNTIIPATIISGGAIDICYRYGYVIIICLLIGYIFYYSYNSFYENQDCEPFIEKTVSSDPSKDKSFDFNVDNEIEKLSTLQEQYLRKLNNKQ
jgi:hypothetical protein